MVIDIVKFFFIYSLVLFAFACGLNQLLWYFSDLERQKCFHLPNGNADFDNFGDACMKWRSFSNVFESSQSLFWASFGLVDLSNFELTGIKTYTRFWGLLMFGSYSVINVIVLLNLLIAMMSNSYAIIEEHSDTEWKFARTKLWLSYFEESATLPPPFNLIPTPKLFLKLLGLRKKDKLKRLSSKIRNREEKERDYKYSAVMRALVWRYVAAMHKKEEENPVTEDDVNELKSDISSFRYEILEVLHLNGMDTSSAERKEKAILGKKNKVWERRLMKDFKVGPVATEDDEYLLYAPPSANETATARFRRLAKLAILNSGMNKWRQVVKGACIASQIGHCHNRDSFKKQQDLQKAILAAQKLSLKSPAISRPVTPINLSDITGSGITNVIQDISGNKLNTSTAFVIQLNENLSLVQSKNESNLINFNSEKTSPSPQGRRTPSSFSHILGSEFLPEKDTEILRKPTSMTSEPVADKSIEENKISISQDSRDSSTRIDIIDKIGDIVKSDEQFEIKDVLDTSTIIFSAGLVQPESMEGAREITRSPELKVVGTDGQHISLNDSVSSEKTIDPTHKKHSSHSTTSTNNNSGSEISEEANETTISRIQIQEEKDLVFFESDAKPIQNDNDKAEKVSSRNKSDSSMHQAEIKNTKASSQQYSSVVTEPEYISAKVEDTSTDDLSYSEDVKEQPDETVTEAFKLKGPSVTFSPLLDDELDESSRLAEPIVPEKIEDLSRSPLKSSLKTFDQSPSTSALSTSGPQSLSISDQGKSPLASRNIQRVQKKYQPKHGWL